MRNATDKDPSIYILLIILLKIYTPEEERQGQISGHVPTNFELQRLKGTLLLKLGKWPPISANWR